MNILAQTKDYLAILTEDTLDDLKMFQEAGWKLIEVIPDDYSVGGYRHERNMVLFGKGDRWYK